MPFKRKVLLDRTRPARYGRSVLVIFLLFASLATSLANKYPLTKDGEYISFSYEESPVDEVIEDLERRYDLAFSYSPTPKLMDCTISARSGLVELTEALSILFNNTPIEYRIINGRIAVRYSSRLAEELLAIEAAAAPEPETKKTPDPKRPVRRVNTLFGKKKTTPEEEMVVVDTVAIPPRPSVTPAAEIPREETTEIPWQSSLTENRSRRVNREVAKQRKLARVSILPGLSSSKLKEGNTIHTLSFNLPAGLSGGLVGAEIGVAFNGINGDMEGVQISGGLNIVQNHMTGLQIAGIGNGAGIGTGIQIAGAFNYCRRTLAGTQMSSLLNVALNGVNSQYSLGLNLVQGDVKRQVGLVNRAVNVERGQIGIVNVADTVGGRSFGLINFVRKGYNVMETARTSVTPFAANLKLGSHRLYNVFELGWGRRDLLVATDGMDDERNRSLIWSVGYGFGWANRLNKSGSVRNNFELVGSHLNRGTRWENRLNFIGSIRWTIDFPFGEFSHVFIGPTMNLHFSQLNDRELDGLFVSGWKLWSRRYDKTIFRGVLGIRFGMRLGKH